jgi:anaerobic selenocysteine-containing dehydrogenase
VVGISRPVLDPLYETNPIESTFITLAKKMGPKFAQNFPWTDHKELLLSRLSGLYSAKRGTVLTSDYEAEQLRLLEERGWWTPAHRDQGEFMEDLLDKGGWQDPSFHFNERGFMYQTPSRKLIFPAHLDPEKFLIDFSGEESEFPFILHLFDLPFTSTGSSVDLPWHQENLGFRFNLKWKTWVEINPETAKEHGIRDKDLVEVISPFGRIEAVARVFPGIAPDIAGIPMNMKEDVFEELEAEQQNDPAYLIGDFYDSATGMISRRSTRVKINKLKRRRT